jgi:flavin-dependent dehydrogenase
VSGMRIAGIESGPMDFDAIVVGGGPAGSTAAHLMAHAGKCVLVLEKDVFPRFHIGESLLPFAMSIFERLGVAETLASTSQRKLGAFFSEEGTPDSRKVVFADGLEPGHGLAFQVKRAEFDQMLLEAARQAGADVRIGWRVEALMKDHDAVIGVSACDPEGKRVDLSARVVVDATGRDALGSRAGGGIVPEAALRRGALYAHFRNVPRAPEETEGDIRMVVFGTGWWWFIPFSDGTWSVGVVSSETPPGSSLEERFDAMIAGTETVKSRLAASERICPVRSASDYSYSVRTIVADGYVAVGDAAGFLDPIFSSGVFLALATGEKAADEIIRALEKPGYVSARAMRRYERFARRGFARFRKFVIGFYDPAFRNIFYQRPPLRALYTSVTSILAGGVFRPSAPLRFWSGIFLYFTGRESRKRQRELAAGAPS